MKICFPAAAADGWEGKADEEILWSRVQLGGCFNEGGLDQSHRHSHKHTERNILISFVKTRTQKHSEQLHLDSEIEILRELKLSSPCSIP